MGKKLQPPVGSYLADPKESGRTKQTKEAIRLAYMQGRKDERVALLAPPVPTMAPSAAFHLTRYKLILALEWALPAALEHYTADLKCGRSWSCACGACRATRDAGPVVRLFVMSRSDDPTWEVGENV